MEVRTELNEWYQKVKSCRYDFYKCLSGYLQCGMFIVMLEQLVKEYSDVESIPQPTDISYRTESYQIKSATYNTYTYNQLICDIFTDITLEGEGIVIKWCLMTSKIHKRDFGKFVRVEHDLVTWIYPLPELDGKQSVSLLEIRNCIPNMALSDYELGIGYVIA